MPEAPSRVLWTDHALVKARMSGVSRADVEDRVLAGHEHRRRNSGAAEWRVEFDRWVIVYDHPYGGDATAARVVTMWRQG